MKLRDSSLALATASSLRTLQLFFAPFAVKVFSRYSVLACCSVSPFYARLCALCAWPFSYGFPLLSRGTFGVIFLTTNSCSTFATAVAPTPIAPFSSVRPTPFRFCAG